MLIWPFLFELIQSFTVGETALTEASYVLISFLQSFKGLECRDPRPWEESFSVAYTNRHGAKVSLIVA